MQYRSIKRRNLIIETLSSQGRKSVQDLSEIFEVSIQTIRADLRALSKQGLVFRDRGDAMAFSKKDCIHYDQRRDKNTQGKEKIAKLCSQQISNYQSIFLGNGSTVSAVSTQLDNHKGLHVMSSNINAIQYLLSHPDCEIILSGGRVRKNSEDIKGGDAICFFQKYRADIGIVTADAIDKNGIIYDYSEDDAMTREAIIKYSRYCFLVIDSTKFNSESRCASGSISDFNKIITDQQPASNLYSKILAKGIELISQ